MTGMLIEFTSTSCPPCRAMKPHVAKLVEKYPDQVKIFNVDDEEGLAAADIYNIISVPTFILERDGQAKKIHSGSMTPDQLEAFLL